LEGTLEYYAPAQAKIYMIEIALVLSIQEKVPHIGPSGFEVQYQGWSKIWEALYR
jgi:hypothetical protein